MALNIRKATTEDFESIWKIFSSIVSAGDTYPFAPDTTRKQAYDIWIRVPKATFVAERDKEVLGPQARLIWLNIIGAQDLFVSLSHECCCWNSYPDIVRLFLRGIRSKWIGFPCRHDAAEYVPNRLEVLCSRLPNVQSHPSPPFLKLAARHIV